MTINMKTTTKRVVSNCKSKRCKKRTTKIKITTTKKVINNCSQDGASLKCLNFKAIQLESCIGNIMIIRAPKRQNVHKILVVVAKGRGNGGQDWATKLGFRSFLPYHLWLKKYLKKNHVCWNQRWIFLCPFLFILMLHSIFLKRVVMFNHGSLNICSCMSGMMLIRCWVIKEFSCCVFDPPEFKNA